MVEEDLRIGIDRIAVSYVFRNTSVNDVTGEVIFPLPPISLGSLMNSDFNLPEDLDRDNLVDFSARVDGVAVAVAVDRIAVIEPEWDEARPPQRAVRHARTGCDGGSGAAGHPGVGEHGQGAVARSGRLTRRSRPK